VDVNGAAQLKETRSEVIGETVIVAESLGRPRDFTHFRESEEWVRVRLLDGFGQRLPNVENETREYGVAVLLGVTI
jgi:hypothetical protein